MTQVVDPINVRSLGTDILLPSIVFGMLLFVYIYYHYVFRILRSVELY